MCDLTILLPCEKGYMINTARLDFGFAICESAMEVEQASGVGVWFR